MKLTYELILVNKALIRNLLEEVVDFFTRSAANLKPDRYAMFSCKRSPILLRNRMQSLHIETCSATAQHSLGRRVLLELLDPLLS